MATETCTYSCRRKRHSKGYSKMVLVFKKQEMPAEMKTGNENVKKAGEPFKIKLNFGLGGKKNLGKSGLKPAF